MFNRPASVRALSAAALGLLLGACGTNPVEVCTGEAVPGVVVEVRDAQTGAPAAEGAVLVVREGSYADSASAPASAPEALVLAAAHERPGTYDVAVRKAGYREWTASGVRVRQGRCHVVTAQLKTNLERAP